MISHRYKFIFFHIPKSGGTSVEHALYRYASESKGGEWAIKNKCWRNKELFDFARQHPNYYSFAFCRDPRQRFVSAWNHFKHAEGSVDIEEFLVKTELFLDQDPSRFYAAIPINETRINLLNSKNCPIIDQLEYPFRDTNTGYHLLPQRYFLRTGIDFLGRLENIREDFRSVTKAILGESLEIPRKNQTDSKSFTTEMSPSQVGRVELLYAGDIDHFGY